MNKKDYIKAVDNITAPESLIKKLEALDPPAKKKVPVWKSVTAIAACFVPVYFNLIMDKIKEIKLGGE